MSKLLKLNFSFLLVLIFSALLTACVPPVSNNKLLEAQTATQVLVFANEAAVAAYSYNFVNYRQNFQTASHYFTPQGWQAFQAALNASGNLEAIIRKKLVVSAVATGSPVILDQNIQAGAWLVQMPMLISYQSATQVARHAVIVKLSIVKTSPHIGTRGLGVAGFVVQ